jgi:type VI secretion system secreted protein VgrG
LTDEHGNPVPDVSYSVTLPDGSVMTGSLDDQGFARFDDIDPGKCLVSFPEIHAKEWKPV